MKYFYQRIKDLKEDNDLKQKDVAKIIGVAENHYGKYERGEVDITFSRVIELAKYYNVSLDYIAGLTDDKGGNHCNYIKPEERLLLSEYNGLTEAEKKYLNETIKFIYEERQIKEDKKSAI